MNPEDKRMYFALYLDLVLIEMDKKVEKGIRLNSLEVLEIYQQAFSTVIDMILNKV